MKKPEFDMLFSEGNNDGGGKPRLYTRFRFSNARSVLAGIAAFPSF